MCYESKKCAKTSNKYGEIGIIRGVWVGGLFDLGTLDTVEDDSDQSKDARKEGAEELFEIGTVERR